MTRTADHARLVWMWELDRRRARRIAGASLLLAIIFAGATALSLTVALQIATYFFIPAALGALCTASFLLEAIRFWRDARHLSRLILHTHSDSRL